ncbi:hypothetical protein [Paenarthrobacter ureafaciens]|uniref:hypothetical protein n=1 Tax=Paenarthrobacter ureafaciens TaxID=37931 RepID=UPI0009ADA882|nr:hypothetical protein [Paenarthrobacter ureafaciens]GLU58558.1 hypothetical protein Pure01_10710 [Paenarthrobacter ureafaciens]GLU61803.1 hypothetical protein Pure02_00530 [Paenarthrobacter ureafaciens]GLU66077.1 hypothetical protein Pure03_00530 [Paenarthrobacter ureafaciens]GLU71599.1 hypothetical protein Pure04_13140 [Paenarthrobacter ureafaciens]GLU74614.1 hypothetical protein Pure05_00540 [Paenarthrobacter ureafaciens]
MEFLIPLLGSALGGAVIAGLFQILKTRQDGASEHSKWLRDNKLEIYIEVLRLVREDLDSLSSAAESDEPSPQSLRTEPDTEYVAKLALIGAATVQHRLQELFDVLDDWEEALTTPGGSLSIEAIDLEGKANDASLRLIAAMQQDLRVTT